MVAVVGTRRSTAYGRDAARRIAGGLAAAGVTVVSGLAAGIDGIAHRAAGEERTIAVLGCGVDVVFPAEHRPLQAAIGRDGLLLTEQLPGTAPFGPNFPRRNRIIAGLVRGVVVVEAPSKSGALSTATLALDHGVQVFAVPGPITGDRSAGANALIRDGGVLVTSAREILEALELPLPAEDVEEEVPPIELEGQGLALWRALGAEPKHVDEISTAVGLEAHLSLASLLSLEVQGHARQLPGLRFVRM
jgi:DNA processing protein